MATWNGTHALEHQQNKCLWPEMLSNSSVDASVLFKVLFNVFPSAALRPAHGGCCNCYQFTVTMTKEQLIAVGALSLAKRLTRRCALAIALHLLMNDEKVSDCVR